MTTNDNGWRETGMVKFSVIIPVYNVEKYLRECLDSVVNQAYKNLQIICIDDGSTDTSGKILDEYAKKYSFVEVIHKENTGYGNSMNVGIKYAQGEYIGIVESDDRISENMFAMVAEEIENAKSKLDILKYSFTSFNNEKQTECKLFDCKVCDRIFSPKDEEYMPLFRVPCSIWSAVYRRDFLEENNIRFNETPGASYQDTSFTFKIWISAEHVMLKNESVYFYRYGHTEASVQAQNKVFCVCDEIAEIDKFLQKKGQQPAFVTNAKYVYMFHSYWWNYCRLQGENQHDFYNKMVETLEEMQKDPKLVYTYFQEDEWARIKGILVDPEMFYRVEHGEYEKIYMDHVLNKYTMYDELYRRALSDLIKSEAHFVIYGGGAYGKKFLNYMQKNGHARKIRGFMVTNPTENEKQIEGFKVYDVKQVEKIIDENTVIIVAVRNKIQLPILEELQKHKVHNVVRMDDNLLDIMNE